MTSMGFEPAIPSSERPQTYTLDRATFGTDTTVGYFLLCLCPGLITTFKISIFSQNLKLS
jgi:hypothetical protein